MLAAGHVVIATGSQPVRRQPRAGPGDGVAARGIATAAATTKISVADPEARSWTYERDPCGAATLALAAGVELKVVQDMMGHASIVLTADTYTSVLPEVARTAAEQVATLIVKAGHLIPGTTRARRSPGRRKRKPRSAAPARLTLAHPARQITRPRRPGTSPA